MELAFSKMHGVGNDFVVIEDLDADWEFSDEAVQWLCDRHFGVGADGVIMVRRATSPDADFYMHYRNADGSIAEMCGNGVRCFVKYLVDHGLLAEDAEATVVETLGGLKSITFTRDYAGLMHVATVDMGEPVLTPADIPSTFSGEAVYECPVETEHGTFAVTALSMGNPHAVIWVDDVDEAPVDTVGPAIERHDAFPARTNVEFAQFVDAEHIRLRVWERGVGETLACGTGASAVMVAATLSCRTGRHAVIELPGGELLLSWHEDNHVFLTGPATEVFRGTVLLEEDDG